MNDMRILPLEISKEEERRTPPPPQETSDRVWKVEEVTLLKELHAIYKDHKYSNLEISKILTTKTAEQIRSKRVTLRTANMEGDLQEGGLETEDGCDLVEPSIASAGPETNEISEEMVHEWRQSLKNEIENQTEVPPVLRDIYTRLNEIWCESKENRQLLIEKMDNFISTSLYGALRNTSNVKDKLRYNQKANYNRRDGEKKKASRH